MTAGAFALWSCAAGLRAQRVQSPFVEQIAVDAEFIGDRLDGFAGDEQNEIRHRLPDHEGNPESCLSHRATPVPAMVVRERGDG